MTLVRGTGPIASVLLPARGRPALLRRAVQSCIDRAANATAIEVLVRVDADDPGNHLPLPAQAKLVIGHRGRGYSDVDRFINELLPLATGDWIVPFNDDCVMITEDWDRALEWLDGPDEAVAFRTCNQMGVPHTVLPIVRRAACNAIGMVSGNAHFDAWIDHIYASMGRLFQSDLRIHHDHTPGDRGREPPDCFRELCHWYKDDASQEAIRAKLRALMEPSR